MNEKVAVLGAGMVGTCCALEMQNRGYEVTLIDRLEAGCETSYGNAGVIARSSIIPINGPALWKSLSSLICNNKASFRYDPIFMAKNITWATKFLMNTRQNKFKETVTALNDLISLSITQHTKWAKDAGVQDLMRDEGWHYLYRNDSTFKNAALARQTFEEFNVSTKELCLEELKENEPSLQPIFKKALWIKDGLSVDDPQKLVQAYFNLFLQKGGTFLKEEIKNISSQGTGSTLELAQSSDMLFDKVIVCLGPWAKNFLADQGYKITMAYERGYHMHYSTHDTVSLKRPFYDVDGGYVMAPMAQGMRLSTGVDLSDINAPHQLSQLNQAEISAKEAINLAGRIEDVPWMGSRPTFPDSRPVIGALPNQKNIWFAFGHQHIGLSTGTGTAKLIGALIAKEKTLINAAPFNPERFMSRIC